MDTGSVASTTVTSPRNLKASKLSIRIRRNRRRETSTSGETDGPANDDNGGAKTNLPAEKYSQINLDISEDSDDDDKSKHSVNGDEDKPIVDSILEDVKSGKRGKLSHMEQQLLSEVINPANISTTYGDVCVQPHIIETIQTRITLPLHPEYLTGILKTKAICGILLYGPPGTGKTMLCQAVAKAGGVRMLQVSPSTVTHKCFGDSEKCVKAVFLLAHKLAPCVVFLDEVDALLSSRSSEDHSTARVERAMMTEFLTGMDGLVKAKGVIVIGATNRPHDIDDAILRRLPSRLFVDLPDGNQRERILRLNLRDEIVDDGLDYSRIASLTNAYSGSDLMNLCVAAAQNSLKDWLSEHQVYLRGIHGNDAAPLPPRIISLKHFLAALNEIRASTSESAPARYALMKWASQYASGAVPANETSNERDTQNESWLDVISSTHPEPSSSSTVPSIHVSEDTRDPAAGKCSTAPTTPSNNEGKPEPSALSLTTESAAESESIAPSRSLTPGDITDDEQRSSTRIKSAGQRVKNPFRLRAFKFSGGLRPKVSTTTRQ